MAKIIRFLTVLSFFLQGYALAEQESTSGSNENKTVFLTGAAGFIGSNFLEYMFNKYPNYNFIVLDALTYAGSLSNIPDFIKESPRFTFVHDTITNFPVVDSIMEKADFVVHYAAETHVTRSILNDYEFLNTDILGTRTLLVALVKHAKTVQRFIHISTSEVYGTAEYHPMDELHLLNPRSPYAAAKAAADRLVFAYNCTYDIPTVTIRPFNNYGPKQHLEKLIPHFIASAIRGESLTIHGDGTQERDWVHTYDTARAVDKALHIENFASIKNQEINVGSGKSISVLTIAKMILQIFNLAEDHLTFVPNRPGQVDCHISSTEKAKRLLGWETTISFEEGLKSTIDWYIANPDHWKKMEDEELTDIEKVAS